MIESELIRALRIIAMTDEERLQLIPGTEIDEEPAWFLEHIDGLAPELLKRGWIEHMQFAHQRGCVVVTDGQGDLRRVEITDLGRKQLNAAVSIGGKE
jgi:hypothetical protein